MKKDEATQPDWDACPRCGVHLLAWRVGGAVAGKYCPNRHGNYCEVAAPPANDLKKQQPSTQ